MTSPKLPSPETYEQELRFMPYKRSLAMVQNIVCADAPRRGTVLDIMCGPGYLAGWISAERPDLWIQGVDLDKRYVFYARKNNANWVQVPNTKIKIPHTIYGQGDVLYWQPNPQRQFNVVLCTGALHHIPYDKQEKAVAKIADLTKPEGFAIISDCYIDDYKNEKERQLATARLGYEYLRETIKNGEPTPPGVVQACLDIMTNDIQGLEFKTSLEKRLPLLHKTFRNVKTMKTWPNKQIGGFGDYVHILRR